jgi:predicted metal-binding membrane protein
MSHDGLASSSEATRPRLGLARSGVVWAIVIAWLLAIVAESTGRGHLLHHDALAHSHLPWLAVFGLFLLAWQVMIAAMMLPSSLPLIRLFNRVAAGQPRPMQSKLAFLGGYAVVWSAFGAAAMVGDLQLHHLVEHWTWLAERPQVIAGSVLIMAGAFQFSSLKDRCLSVCRSPGLYIMQYYRRGVRAALNIGVRHGLFCMGCCWALMLVGFAAGVANLWWMVALTAVMVFEKTGPSGDRAVKPIGLGLIGLGLLVLFVPAIADVLSAG